ncbi:uncharacterized protein LOC116299188, partial [Actinia tenebrosa]|uniref:Uncharacterized protein LOC116299188 n=1 Tax=Actinia tenebrosa TaxID=6105 RepID=A0A6P8IDQ0_ACTTE
MAAMTLRANEEYMYRGTMPTKIENMDLPLGGDFSCKRSQVPGKCAFYLELHARVPRKGKAMCSWMGPKCKGFVYNSGINLIILKNSIKGSPKYSLGFELYVKKAYVDLVHVVIEECAPSLKDGPASDQVSDLACHIPKLNPFDETIMGLIQKKTLECPGKSITQYDGSTLTFITEGNDVQEVTYETITRENNDFGHGIGRTGTLTRSKNT